MKIEITEKQEAQIIKHRNNISERIRKQEGENISYNVLNRIVSIISDRFDIMLEEDFNSTTFLERYKNKEIKNE